MWGDREHGVPDETETVLNLTAGSVHLELTGTGAFVGRQVQSLRALLEAVIVGTAGAVVGGESADHAAKDSDGPESIEEFYAARPRRDGRGAIQDRILLFIYYLQRVDEKQAVRKDDIDWCFKRVGLAAPKNLLGVLGHMRRKLGLLEPGDGRGLYRLAQKGVRYVEEHLKRA